MTKANDLASLLDANGDVVSSALDNVPAAPTPSLSSLGIPNHDDITVDGSGNLGLGTSSLESWDNAWVATQVGSGSSLTGASGATSRTFLSDNAYADGANQLTSWKYMSTNEASLYAQLDGTHSFRVASSGTADTAITWSEAMRIDSSGNLLVGTTSPLVGSNNQEGIALSAGSYGGYASFSRSGGESLDLNRKTNDGTILNFRKDGSTVGSIGVSSGDNLQILGAATNHAGFEFGTNLVIPKSNGATADGAIDLGFSSGRFSNLYLSGSISDGTNSKTVADIVSGGGKVGQVITSVDTSAYSVSGSGQVLNWSINITPSSTSSKILLQWMIFWNSTNPNGAMLVQRNGGNLNPNITVASSYTGTGHFQDLDEAPISTWNTFPQSMTAYDSPNSTSQQTYTFGIKNVGGSASIFTGRSSGDSGRRAPSFIGYAMEILP